MTTTVERQPTSHPFVEIVIANVDETHGPVPEGKQDRSMVSTLWQKAILAPDHRDYYLVAPRLPTNLNPSSASWHSPKKMVIPCMRTGQLCDDLLDDDEAWRVLIHECKGRGPIRLRPQVYSTGVVTLIGAFREAGIEVDVSGLPSAPAEVVRYWNTKVGGRHLLQSIASVRPSLPGATICKNIGEALSLVTGRPDQALVIKANSSIGGSGIRFFPAERDGNCNQTDASDVLVTKVEGKNKLLLESDEEQPCLVEEMVGTPTQNLSPTADYNINPSGEIELIGIGVQILLAGRSYCGVSSFPSTNAWIRDRCVALGYDVCAGLSFHGYRGPVNIDFVSDGSERVLIAEMNLRQSAPLDQFLILRRLYGSDWHKCQVFHGDEGVMLRRSAHTTNDVARLLMAELNLRNGEAVCPLAIGENLTTSTRWVSLLTVSDTPPRLEEISSKVWDILENG